ncbi:MAG: hypothetical protein EZS28_047037 [Streblomastix strix]|uniref:Uncharacterized protein n=1 Tax=Streblomastix strix TaxID=222440 RepID=A0A5J4TFZ6_9EUKA|nr:MAG: hypothetical protein EZS28_047037 [Streblomastix strix]
MKPMINPISTSPFSFTANILFCREMMYESLNNNDNEFEQNKTQSIPSVRIILARNIRRKHKDPKQPNVVITEATLVGGIETYAMVPALEEVLGVKELESLQYNMKLKAKQGLHII